MVAQPVSFLVSDTRAESVTESAVADWAVFNMLETMPATPETQLAFEDARRRVQRQIAATGIDTTRIDRAFRRADLPRFQMRGDPPLGS